MQVCSVLGVLHGCGFLLSGRRTPGVWPWGPQTGEIGGQVFGDRSLKSQRTIRVRA